MLVLVLLLLPAAAVATATAAATAAAAAGYYASYGASQVRRAAIDEKAQYGHTYTPPSPEGGRDRTVPLPPYDLISFVILHAPLGPPSPGPLQALKVWTGRASGGAIGPACKIVCCLLRLFKGFKGVADSWRATYSMDWGMERAGPGSG